MRFFEKTDQCSPRIMGKLLRIHLPLSCREKQQSLMSHCLVLACVLEGCSISQAQGSQGQLPQAPSPSNPPAPPLVQLLPEIWNNLNILKLQDLSQVSNLAWQSQSGHRHAVTAANLREWEASSKRRGDKVLCNGPSRTL